MTTLNTLERIEKSIQATNELLSVAEKYYKEDYTIFEYGGVLKKPGEYKRELLYLKSLRDGLLFKTITKKDMELLLNFYAIFTQ